MVRAGFSWIWSKVEILVHSLCPNPYQPNEEASRRVTGNSDVNAKVRSLVDVSLPRVIRLPGVRGDAHDVQSV